MTAGFCLCGQILCASRCKDFASCWCGLCICFAGTFLQAFNFDNRNCHSISVLYFQVLLLSTLVLSTLDAITPHR